MEIGIPGYVMYSIDCQANISSGVCAMFHKIIGPSIWATSLLSQSLASTNCGIKSMLGILSLSVQPIDLRTLPYITSIQISPRTLFKPCHLMCQFICLETCNSRLENTNIPAANSHTFIGTMVHNWCFQRGQTLCIWSATVFTEILHLRAPVKC